MIDGLREMGRLLHHVVEDGYRTQLRIMPWSYSLVYWLLERVAPVRWLTARLLTIFGGRGLARAIEAHAPDVVVSTYPSVTVVLARLRRNGVVRCPTVATITDMTGLFFWAHRDIDMHVVMYEDSIADVTKIAGAESVEMVRPLIGLDFLEPRCPQAARAELGLPEHGRVVLVSGGGWGVGDIEGAVQELHKLEDATIVCLAGKNEEVEEKLSSRFAGDERVRVLGFTDQMPQLLSAADVLVHSTGGVTCLEAMATGCPVVSYGLPVGHAKLNTRAMADRDLLRLANSVDELREHVDRSAAERAAARADEPATAPELDARDVVLRSQPRVRPLPAWRLRTMRVATTALVALTAGTWVMSTDEFTSFANAFLGRPLKTVNTRLADVELIVRAPGGEMDAVAARLRRDGLHASLAATTAPDPQTISELRAGGDAAMPALRPAKGLNWTTEGQRLRRIARELHLGRHFLVLSGPSPGFGQIVATRIVGGRLVIGEEQVGPGSALPARRLHHGDIVVVNLSSATSSFTTLDRVAGELNAQRLGAVPLTRS